MTQNTRAWCVIPFHASFPATLSCGTVKTQALCWKKWSYAPYDPLWYFFLHLHWALPWDSTFVHAFTVNQNV